MTTEEMMIKIANKHGMGKLVTGHSVSYFKEAMIEFAKYHVESALKAASRTGKIDLFVRPDRKGTKYKKVGVGESYDLLTTRQMWKIDKNSILNSYPLENIK